MIKVIRVTIQKSPHESEPNTWIMDVVTTNESGQQKASCFVSPYLIKLLDSLPQTIEELERAYA